MSRFQKDVYYWFLQLFQLALFLVIAFIGKWHLWTALLKTLLFSDEMVDQLHISDRILQNIL